MQTQENRPVIATVTLLFFVILSVAYAVCHPSDVSPFDSHDSDGRASILLVRIDLPLDKESNPEFQAAIKQTRLGVHGLADALIFPKSHPSGFWMGMAWKVVGDNGYLPLTSRIADKCSLVHPQEVMVICREDNFRKIAPVNVFPEIFGVTIFKPWNDASELIHYPIIKVLDPFDKRAIATHESSSGAIQGEVRSVNRKRSGISPHDLIGDSDLAPIAEASGNIATPQFAIGTDYNRRGRPDPDNGGGISSGVAAKKKN
jgi:hypothetical protein